MEYLQDKHKKDVDEKSNEGTRIKHEFVIIEQIELYFSDIVQGEKNIE